MELIKDKKRPAVIKLQRRLHAAKKRLLINNPIDLKVQALPIKRLQIPREILKTDQSLYEGTIF